MIEKKTATQVSSWLLSLVIPAVLLTACAQQNGPLQADNQLSKQEETLWAEDTKAALIAFHNHDYKSAKQLYRKAYQDALALGQEHPAVSASLSNMADFYYVQGDGQQADSLYRRALKLKEKNLGVEHVELASDLIGIGSVAFMQKKYADAMPYFERALKIQLKALGPDDAHVAETYACIGRCDLNLNKYADAVSQYKNCLAILDKTSHPAPPSMLDDYAKALRQDKQIAAGSQMEARAKDIRSKTQAVAGSDSKAAADDHAKDQSALPKQ